MENNEKGLFAGAVLIIVIVVAVSMRVLNPSIIENNIDPSKTVVVLDQASCAAAGGNWNECTSACRGQEDEEACIALCVPRCECESDNACPFGYSCTDYIKEVGVCSVN